MTVRNRTIQGGVASEHIVQFFDTDESRALNVAAFLAEGYRKGEPLVVIVRPLNWVAMAENLRVLGVPVRQAMSDGMLVVKDADDTLRRLSRSGSPDPALFELIVGRAVAALGRQGRVRAYGEMVDILAQRGELTDAIQLEALWNDLSERVSLLLMCGYAAAHFVASGTHAALLQICKSHTAVHRHAQDPLASWLLDNAHGAARPSVVPLR